MATRPIEIYEYEDVISLLINGFVYMEDEREKIFRPNVQVALILQLQASLGLRVGDILNLKLSNFKNGKLETTERKTGKLQYRDINSSVINAIYNYAINNNKKADSKLFAIGIRAVQKQLKIVVDHLGLKNIGTHSFRKLYAVTIYENNNHNIQLLKELLNHVNISTTQRYIRVSQEMINKASKEVNYMIGS